MWHLGVHSFRPCPTLAARPCTGWGWTLQLRFTGAHLTGLLQTPPSSEEGNGPRPGCEGTHSQPWSPVPSSLGWNFRRMPDWRRPQSCPNDHLKLVKGRPESGDLTMSSDFLPHVTVGKKKKKLAEIYRYLFSLGGRLGLGRNGNHPTDTRRSCSLEAVPWHHGGNSGLERILKITQRWLQAVTEKWGRKGFLCEYRVYGSTVKNYYFIFRPMVACRPLKL